MIEEAALNNAAWCDAVCRAHGLPGAFTPRAWTNPRRTPPFYPDAVTLSPEATSDDVLPLIDATPGSSIKDSFATLTPPGFTLLFEATWLHAPATGNPDDPNIRWSVVSNAETLRAWEKAWGGQGGLFTEPLLADPSVRILAGRAGDEVVSGCVLNETPGGRTAGVSNVFGDAWPHVRAQAATLFPGRDLVGYESDPGPAVEHGFTPIGPLRVWLRT